MALTASGTRRSLPLPAANHDLTSLHIDILHAERQTLEETQSAPIHQQDTESERLVELFHDTSHLANR